MLACYRGQMATGDGMAVVLESIVHIAEQQVATEFGPVTQVIYPEPSSDARHFRELRTMLCISQADAAKALEITLPELLDLEHGKKRCEWASAEQALMRWKLR